MAPPLRLSIDLPRRPTAQALARSAVTESCGRELAGDRLQDLHLVVSELVANALRHGDGRIELRLSVDEGVVRGEVVDGGGGFEAQVRQAGIEEIGGRGLAIVACLAERWGVYEGSSHVWFELGCGDDARTPPELG